MFSIILYQLQIAARGLDGRVLQRVGPDVSSAPGPTQSSSNPYLPGPLCWTLHPRDCSEIAIHNSQALPIPQPPPHITPLVESTSWSRQSGEQVCGCVQVFPST